MRITSEDFSSFIDLNPSEYEVQRFPSVNMNITVENQGFKGCAECVWFSFEEINKFILELNKLEHERRGKVTLESMSPNEFCLEFKAYDRLGHIGLEYEIRKENKTYDICNMILKGGFKVYSSEVLKFINEFKSIVSKAHIER